MIVPHDARRHTLGPAC